MLLESARELWAVRGSLWPRGVEGGDPVLDILAAPKI